MSAGHNTVLSIVTPTLNAEAYLAECLQSIESQHMDGVEHVVVDGGSSDRTEEIVRRYPHSTWLSAPGLNQSQAINLGFRRASAPVVAWLCADDMYLDGAFEFVLQQFRGDAELEVLYGDCEVIGPSGEQLWWERPGVYDFQRLLRRGNYIAQPSVFMRRSLLTHVGFLDESIEYGMDYEFWLRLRGRRVTYVPRLLAAFRWHPTSKSAGFQIENWRSFLRIVRQHGGGWTPEIALAFVRLLITMARLRIGTTLTGSTPLRPVTRGHHLIERGEISQRQVVR
jgi:glycosyltransferase involved in cell wall biosynthesis